MVMTKHDADRFRARHHRRRQREAERIAQEDTTSRYPVDYTHARFLPPWASRLADGLSPWVGGDLL